MVEYCGGDVLNMENSCGRRARDDGNGDDELRSLLAGSGDVDGTRGLGGAKVERRNGHYGVS